MSLIPTGPPVFAAGMLTGPAGLAQICATGNLSGLYYVTYTFYIDGAAVSTVDDDNILIRIGSVSNAVIVPSNGSVITYAFLDTVTAQPFIARVNAAATSTAVYHASIIAVPMGNDD